MSIFDRKVIAKSQVTAEELNGEISETLQAFRDRAKQEAKRFADATDSEYWVAVCFKTRDEKERFLRKFGLANLGDKYLDGRRVEEKLDKLK